ncbi:hypothetical protein Q73A0000_10075 [Kaistella flava (ex Peng et al. 2021)]|uniref:Fibrobacter succinogenes major paralogous domain-containing protein n=1 Tax=Kaistella flava (ex Peng et al. 2021) TaxID=2038776 RepID=A0A7M2Y8W9_9FLAO|nr:FISUMP domain-containing protein [Kaistella flava (ex Peng et al. 2021)]QOW10697.1 hypothetical protein Q73A0000_10075 [Kaistella flava (ex Peng et al. 2021)]
MKSIFAIILLTAIAGVNAQVIIGDAVGTATNKTSVLLEFAAKHNKGIIVPYVRTLPLPVSSTGGTILLDASTVTAARMKFFDGTIWKDLSGQNADISGVLATQPTGVTETNSKAVIGAQSSSADGVLVLESTTKAMVLPIVADVQDIPSPSPGMMVYVDRAGAKRLAVFNGDRWSFWKTIPVVTSLKTGKIWMDRNLGATQVATASNDAASYGDLYQWGRGADGHQLRTSAATTTLSSADTSESGSFIVSIPPSDWRSPKNDNLWQGVSGINNPCPIGFRLPTIAELENERQSWISNDAAGALASPLKLPMAGYRKSNGNNVGILTNVGSYGYYWTSSVASGSARYVGLNMSTTTNTTTHRADGLSIRCIKD